MKNRILISIKYFFLTVLCCFAFIPYLIEFKYGKVDFEQVLFHVFFGQVSMIFMFYLNEITVMAVVMFMIVLLLKKLRIGFKWPCIIFVAGAVILYGHMGVYAFCKNFFGNKSSQIYEKFYAYPYQQEYRFPDKKKNIILIMMESMEKSFQDVEGENLIPYISHLQNKHLSFKGFIPLSGTTWTTAGLVGAHSALPLKAVAYTNPEGILLKAPSFVDILNQNGYMSVFANGGDLSFMGKESYLAHHGYRLLIGKKSLLNFAKHNQNYVIKNPMNDYGLRDEDLYPAVKQELTRLGKKNQPFIFTMLTVDTHAPNGYLSRGCKTKYNDIRDSITCSDEFLKNFMTWLKEQDFYQDTVVVIVGDHLQMATKMTPILNRKKREIVTLVINSDYEKTDINQDRTYSTFDIAPTILEAAGIHIQNHRFGMGVSLLSDQKTILENMTFREFDEEISKPSMFYNSLL